MPLTPEQQQELQELRRLDELEQKYGQNKPEVSASAGAFGRVVQPTTQPSQDQTDSFFNKIASNMKQSIPSSNNPEGVINSIVGGPASNAAAPAMGKLAEFLGKGPIKAGDFLMQKAVGMKKYLPGVGVDLADEGLVGTKGMMQNQVERGLANRGSEIGKIAQSLDDVSTKPVAEKLGERAAKLVSPEGEILPDNIKQFHQYADKAAQASTENSVSGEEAAFRRSQYGKIARDAGRYRDNPAQGLKAQIAGEQQAGYSQALKDAYSNANPGAPNALAKADKAYGSLSKADWALNQPTGLSLPNLISKTVPTAIGGAVGGVPGAVAGAALSTPIVQSGIGQLGVKAGQAMTSPAVQGTMKAAPLGLAELLGRKR